MAELRGLGVPYVVKRGDTLWDIAERELGSPSEWPRLYAFNNRDVVNRTGVRKIDNPDLIYEGEVIRLPRVQPRARVRPSSPPPLGSLRQSPPSVDHKKPARLRDLLPKTEVPFALAYDLRDLPSAKAIGPGYTARLSLSGRLVIELGKRVTLTYVGNGALESSLKYQTDSVLNTLISDTSIKFDHQSKRVSFSNAMISQSTIGGTPKTAIAVEIGSHTGMPVLKTELIWPELKGSLRGDRFVATDFKVVLEIEPDRIAPGLRHQVPSPSPSPNPWLVAEGLALITAALVAEYFSVGASTPWSATAGTAGLTMIGVGINGESVGVPTLSGGRPVGIQ